MSANVRRSHVILAWVKVKRRTPSLPSCARASCANVELLVFPHQRRRDSNIARRCLAAVAAFDLFSLFVDSCHNAGCSQC